MALPKDRIREMTIRQLIMAELEKGSMTAKDLSKAIRISEKEVIAHMDHVAKSLKPPKRLIIEPPVCNKCSFVFKDRKRFSSPSRCPQCRHEGITQPAFRIDFE
jgi:transcriptional regulator